MSFSSIPAELRALPQWTVYRSVIRGDDVTKPPLRLEDLRYGADVHDPSHWGTFERAVEVYEANTSVLSGIGFCLRVDDPYVVIDVDKIEKVPADMLGYRREFEKQVLALATYTEHSPSGRGMHAWLRGSIGDAGRHLKGVGSEVYAWQRFITCTGKVVSADHTGPIVDGQPFLNMLGLGQVRPKVGLVDDPNRPLHLSDREVYEQACAYVSWWQAKFHGQDGCGPGEWSHTFVAVVGVLDKVTGSVDQVRRLMETSPMVTHCQPAASGESRADKCRRTLGDVLASVRRGNRAGSYFADHGRQVWEGICEHKRQRAVAAENEARRLAAEAGNLSTKANSLLEFFPMLADNEHRVLQAPPGVVGEFVEATLRASHAPFLKFAIPATLSALSGIVGRGFKTASGGGINLNFILAAPSSTGKTQSQKAWEKFVNRANQLLDNGSGRPTFNRVINGSANSIQGIYGDFDEMPSCAWFNEECQSQLKMMSDPKSPSDTALRDSYNRLYDVATHTSSFSLPKSVSSRNAALKPIANLSVSTYWTTTTSKFDVFSEDALDGFLSRVTVIRHTGRAGELQRSVEDLPPHLAVVLADRLNHAAWIDQEYKTAGIVSSLFALVGSRLTLADQSLVQELDWEFVTRCEAIKNAALERRLPETYTSASRLPQTAMRIAVLLAVMQNPYAPQVTPEQLKWSFGYLLQNVVSLLSDLDTGELGSGTGDDWVTIARVYTELSARPEYRDLPGVPRNVVFQEAKGRKPFTTHPLGRSKGVTNTLAHMLQEGAMDENTPSTGQRGRPTKYLVPVREHVIWG
jgi:hypothetical protein